MEWRVIPSRTLNPSRIETEIPNQFLKLGKFCRYSILERGSKQLLGSTEVPEGMDLDDAFPQFHMMEFSANHYEFLSDRIRAGAILCAESDLGGEVELLAYTLGDPNFWYGRESTLKYFGILFTPDREDSSL